MHFLRMLALLVFAGPVAAQEVTHDYSGFDRIDFRSGIRAKVTIGEAYSVTTQGVEDAGYAWEFAQDGDQLVVGLAVENSKANYDLSDRFRVTIVVPEFTQIVAREGVHLDVIADALPNADLIAESGAGVWMRNVSLGDAVLRAEAGASIEVTGSCTHLAADADAGSFVDADALVCDTAAVSAAAGSSIRFNATASAEVSSVTGSRVVGIGEGAVLTAEVTGGSIYSVR